jgi:predicted DsbA family dithiol-disulfide isomerase
LEVSIARIYSDCVANDSGRKHVFHDLQPYVCTFEKCEDSDHLYRGRHEWFDHELAMHRREWVCPGHCDEVFGSQEPFETHLAAHYAESAGASLTTLIETCERPTLPSASVQCPFCLEKVVSRKKIRNHIGQHLTDISLRVLPTTLEETESSENEPQNGSTDSEHTTDEKIPMSAARDSLQEALEDLTIRVQDWKGHKVNSFGKLLFHGSYGVLTRKSQAVPKNVSTHPAYHFSRLLSS